MLHSEKAISLIKKYEGLTLTAIWDYKGYSIGYGHTSSDVTKDMTITQNEAEKLLIYDIEKFEKHINEVIRKGNYNFNQNQFDALLSFCYNIGTLNNLTKNCTRTIDEIGEAILLYTKADGKTNQGLVKRRKEEYALYKEKMSDTIFRGRYVVVAKSGLRLREKASLTSKVIAVMPYKSHFVCYGKIVSGKWIYGDFYLGSKKYTGYAHSDFLKKYGIL